MCAGTIGTVLDGIQSVDREPGRLLDVGCGAGELLRGAVGRGFEVTGVDLDEDMVRLAEKAATCRVACAALPDLPFDAGEFDAVVANFVLNHVEDPRAGMHELARVTAPGGTVTATIWPAGGVGWAGIVSDVLAAADVVPLEGLRLPPELDFPRTKEGLGELATGAGLTVSEARDVAWTWQVTPEDLWSGIRAGIGNPGQTYLAQVPEVQVRADEEFVAQARELLEEHAADGSGDVDDAPPDSTGSPADGRLSFTNRAALIRAWR
jgi:SAM-dependent methyltransferase